MALNLEEIRDEIRGLKTGQVVEFAWRCAVRSLSLLGKDGNFNYWKDIDRQKHLYRIFNALDIAKALTCSPPPGSSYANAADYYYYAANAAAIVATATANAANAACNAAANAAYATANAAYATANAAANACNAACLAASAAANAAAYGVDLRTIILEDIEAIKKNRKQKISTGLYGPIWDNFLKALKEADCSYWAGLYKGIFENDFEINLDELDKRLSVPDEIKEQGASAVGHYMEKILDEGAERLNEARIIILGDKGSGKTSLAKRLVDPDAPMPTKEESTAGVDRSVWKLKEEDINVHIWDFAGHTVTHAVHQFFLSERCLYIVVYDGRTEKRNRLEYWLDHMKNYGGDSKAIILVNEYDGHRINEEDIPINNLKEKYSILDFSNFSISKDNEKLKEFRQSVRKYIVDNPSWEKQSIPKSYYKVKEELEGLFDRQSGDDGEEYITREKFDKIAAEVKDKDQLLKDLHHLGVSLWYDEMKHYDTLVLNPEWISQGVYKIINWMNNEKKYDITLQDFLTVFNGEEKRYPEDEHEFLSNLMKHYELAFETKCRKGKQTCLIVPHLLKIDRPKDLPEFSVGESLMCRYKAEQPLPPHTISRFIVRHNEDIKKMSKVWRYGVVLEDDKGSQALVREEDRTISISVKGGDKTNYISRLRDTMNDIFNSYKSQKPTLEYKVESFGKIPDASLWLPDSKIVNYAKANKPYWDDRSGQDINLSQTMNVYNITANSLMWDGHGNRLIDNSVVNTFNFHDCNIQLQQLQGSLNELARDMRKAEYGEEADDLEEVAKLLEQAEQHQEPEQVRKKGLLNKLKRVVEDLGDENSKLYKAVRGIKHGARIVQDIVSKYNEIADWMG